jgi:SAM-dependent methyltransferase
MSTKRELVLGAGNQRLPKLKTVDSMGQYESPLFLDIDENCNPDILWDLNDLPLPFDDNEFDEIHAYEVLEHIGRQGDWKGFFAEWQEYHRILKPGGKLMASVPSINSPWLWGDPGHTRAISVETLTFLDQSAYEEQVGKGAMTDYRHWYQGDFRLLYQSDDESQFFFVMEKH